MSSGVEQLTALEPATIAWIAASLSLGAAFQSAVGFGMALLSVPLLLWAGIPMPQAVALLLGGALLQSCYGLALNREHFDRRRTLRVAVFQWIGIVAGVLCMALLVDREPASLKQLVGAIVLLALAMQLLLRPTPRERLSLPWAALAGISSGYFSGLVGIGGPPLVLYTLGHRWSRDQTRVFLWSQFALGIPLLMLTLVLRLGTELLAWFAAGLLLCPLLMLGTWLGLRLTTRWSAEGLRSIALVLLALIGTINVVAPWLG